MAINTTTAVPTQALWTVEGLLSSISGSSEHNECYEKLVTIAEEALPKGDHAAKAVAVQPPDKETWKQHPDLKHFLV
jgi:hypothetical protein